MPLEYEYRYREPLYDKAAIIRMIKANGGKKQGKYLFRVCVFAHPLKHKYYIRVRDEGFRTTLTIKTQGADDEFPQENEIMINDFNEGRAILEGLGCVKKYCYEKIREIWYIESTSTEICWDTNPGRYDLMEVESETKKQLLQTITLLGLNDLPHDDFDDQTIYDDQFGIDLAQKKTDLTFKYASKILTPLCRKNKKEFKQLIDKQMHEYENLLRKNTSHKKGKVNQKQKHE